MLPMPVEHVIYRENVPLYEQVRHSKAYSYLLAGNGLFKYARSAQLEALIPVAEAQVAGLGELEPFARLRGKRRLPSEVLATILEGARRVARRSRREVMYHVGIDGRRVFVRRPAQHISAAKVVYADGAGDSRVVCDVHSHHDMGAFFSDTDDGDEQGFRFYAVMGKIFSDRPELRVRIGVYGDFWEVPAGVLFAGLGTFADANGPYMQEHDVRLIK